MFGFLQSITGQSNGGGWTPGQMLSGFTGGGAGAAGTMPQGPFMKMVQGQGVIMRSMNDQTLGQGGIMNKIQAGEGPVQSIMKGFNTGGTVEGGTDSAQPSTAGIARTQRGGPINITS